jgi:hypothetical protein
MQNRFVFPEQAKPFKKKFLSKANGMFQPVISVQR